MIKLAVKQQWQLTGTSMIRTVKAVTRTIVVFERDGVEASWAKAFFLDKHKLVRHQNGQKLDEDYEYAVFMNEGPTKGWEVYISSMWSLSAGIGNCEYLYRRKKSVLVKHGLEIGQLYWGGTHLKLVEILSETHTLDHDRSKDKSEAVDIGSFIEMLEFFQLVERDSEEAKPYFAEKKYIDHEIRTDKHGKLYTLPGSRPLITWLNRADFMGFIYEGYDGPESSPILWDDGEALWSGNIEGSTLVHASHVRRML